MLIAVLAIAGGTVALTRIAQKNKKEISLYKSIGELNKNLKLDKMVKKTDQATSDESTKPIPLWHEKEQKPISEKVQETYSIKKDGHHFLRFTSKYLTPYWKPALLGSICLVSFGMYETGFAYSLKIIIDGVSTGTGLALVKPVLLALLLAFPVMAIGTLIGERLSARVTSKVVRDLNHDMFGYLQKLPLGFYKKTKLGDILTRFSSDMIYIRLGMAELIPIAADVFVATLNILVLFFLSWQMALANLVAFPLLVLVLREFTPYFSKTNFALKNEESLVMQAVQENVQAQPMVKSFSVQPFLQDSFATRLDKQTDVMTEALFSRTSFERTIINSLFLAQLFSISVGILLFTGAYISIGTFVSFLLIQNVLSSNMRKLFRNRLNSALISVVGIRRVDQLFHNQLDITDSPDAIELQAFQRDIRFDNVIFGYTKTNQLLKQTHFTIKAGQFVAFVGPSGAGKSTILNLILRFYDVTDGEVRIDGYDVRHLTQASLRAQMGVVLQETFIFNASIFDNIRVVKPDATEADIIQAAQAAELHDFIAGLPEGYQTNAGEAGRRLSGGQKQRIAIARALLCNPAILILDEATSSLDAETAAAVDATIYRLSKQCTVISISHHLRAITQADKIFVLNQGTIIEEGEHQQLLDLKGLYAQLWEAQASHNKPSSE